MRTNIEIQKNVIHDYKLNELSLKDIAKKYNICFNTAKKILLLNNEKLKEFKINSKIENNIVDDYINGISNKVLSQKYSLHRSTIQTILVRNNIKLKSSSETSRKHQIIDENFFNIINTEEKAYILGLLYADGSLRHNGFELTLIETDKEILEKISNILYGKVILNYRKSRNCGNNSKYKSKPQYRLIVTSHIMKNNLIMHGCIQAKTFKIRFPKLNNDMYKHFIRGYFDGDGCFSSSKKKKNIAKVTITSNIYFCDELTKFIENILNVNIKSKIRYGEIGDAVITNRNDIIIFMNWLYDNSTIYLARKSDKYHKFLNSIL